MLTDRAASRQTLNQYPMSISNTDTVWRQSSASSWHGSRTGSSPQSDNSAANCDFQAAQYSLEDERAFSASVRHTAEESAHKVARVSTSRRFSRLNDLRSRARLLQMTLCSHVSDLLVAIDPGDCWQPGPFSSPSGQLLVIYTYIWCIHQRSFENV